MYTAIIDRAFYPGKNQTKQTSDQGNYHYHKGEYGQQYSTYPFIRCSANPNRIIIQADKLRTQQELERLQAKYVGTGHPDTTSWEWKTNIKRDTFASIVGHPPHLSYIALAQNEPTAKVRADMIRVRVPLFDEKMPRVAQLTRCGLSGHRRCFSLAGPPL